MEEVKWKTKDMVDQSGKHIIVTGANSGLGFEAAKGAYVIMASRNMERSKDSKIKILNSFPMPW